MRNAMWGGTLAGVLLVWAAAVSTQATMTTGDIQRLQDAMYDASGDVARLRQRNPELASTLQNELDELRDEVIYLRVKMRREGNVPRSEYTEVRDRVEELRTRARGEDARGPDPVAPAPGDRAEPERPPPPARPPATAPPNTVPVGQEVDVRLQRPLNSGTAQVEDRFEATTVVDLYQGDRVLVPAGSVLRGVVTSVESATRVQRTGRMTLAFDQLRIGTRTYPMRGTVTQALESEGIRGETGRIGTGAGVGAIIGGILGGVRGALAGILIGGGGVIAATEGKEVELPAGTILRVRVDSPIEIR
jgi:hypothetical protein